MARKDISSMVGGEESFQGVSQDPPLHFESFVYAIAHRILPDGSAEIRNLAEVLGGTLIPGNMAPVHDLSRTILTWIYNGQSLSSEDFDAASNLISCSQGLVLATTNTAVIDGLSIRGLSPILVGTNDQHLSSLRHCGDWRVAFIPGGASDFRGASDPVTAIAIIPCYNEIDIIVRTVSRLLDQGIDVHLIDNWSTDGSLEACVSSFEGQMGFSWERFPDASLESFDWKGILDRMDDVSVESEHDWVLHVDADEEIETCIAGMSVRRFLGVVEAAGYDVVDFTLVEFRPKPDSGADLPTRWQFGVRPGARQLERAWRRRPTRVGLSNSGGHVVTVSKRVSPINLVLMHYPLRNAEQARRKIFVDRLPRALEEKMERGWHVHYDEYDSSCDFVWDPMVLNDWDDSVKESYVMELSTRAGIPFIRDTHPVGLLARDESTNSR